MRSVNVPRILVFVMLVGNLASAADWPAYRGNSGRTATTSETLAYPLTEVWKHVPKQKPVPAWPDKFMAEVTGLVFDYAPQVVIVGDMLYFGSTTDNSVWALDAATGKTKWGFTTGGPIRFAPAIWDGKAYVVSDDGFCYCLDAATGKLIWKFFGGLFDSRFIANQRLTSRWLIRSGVAVDSVGGDDRGMVNFAVGMWANEGVYSYALDAATGKQLWVNDTTLKYRTGPHGGLNFAGNKPQGYVAATKNKLAFHNGQGGAYIYNRITGAETQHIDSRGEIRKQGRGDASVLAIQEDGTIESGLYELTSAKIKHSWVVAGDTVIMCKENRITARRGSPHDGTVVWEHTLGESKIRGAAVANGMLVVSTTDGVIHCFKGSRATPPAEPAIVGPGTRTWPRPAPGPAASVLAQCRKHGISRGYALVLGEKDAKLAEALAANTDLQVICVLADAAKANAERIRLRDTTDLYGLEVTVDHLASFEKLPYPTYFANVVVVNRLPAGLPMDEIKRIQRPYGGLVIAGGEVNVRGELPGAMNWNSEVTADQLVKWPLEMLWFGEPGPMNTVEKGTYSPTVVNGIALYLGRSIIAVDAYNGTELWRFQAEGLNGRPEAHKLHHASVTDKYVYWATDRDHTLKGVLDLKTGKPVTGAPAPAQGAGAPPKWSRWRGNRTREDKARYLGMRVHPLTGGLANKGFSKAHGCVGASASAAMDFFRSGSVSYYDFQDDSGVRNLAGLRAACHDSMTPGLGLLLSADGQGAAADGVENKEDYEGGKGCDCRFSFLGALAMVPTTRRSNEDWASFSDPRPQYTAGPINHANMNFGAAGDRRHADKDLWLSTPRHVMLENKRDHWLAMGLPFNAEFYGDSFKYDTQSYRRNSDRWPITGTDAPWIYTSGYRGLKSLALELDYIHLRRQYAAIRCAEAPGIDGKLTDSCWDGAGSFAHVPIAIAQKELYVHQTPNDGDAGWIRYDDDNVYIAYRQMTRPPRAAKPRGAWVVSGRKKDDPMGQDDCLNVHFLGGASIVNLLVSAGGVACDMTAKLDVTKVPGKPLRPKVLDRDISWNGVWKSGVSVTDSEFLAEMAVPWNTLKSRGITRKNISIAVGGRRVGKSAEEAPTLVPLHLSLRSAPPKPYTVRLHFADLENDAPGKRVFDVKLQGKTVLENFDIVAAAGGRNKALVKEFKGITAVNQITLEIVSSAKDMLGPAGPIISGMQVFAEDPAPVPEPVVGLMTNDKLNRGFLTIDVLESRTEENRRLIRGWFPEDETQLQARLKRRGLLPEQENEKGVTDESER